jgi:hopanoid biosynthesis associated RND transporter like protein HpnN
MKEKLEQRLGRMAGGIVEASRTHPRSTLLVCALVTILAAVAAATQLSVDTDPDFMTSPDLEFRKTNAALRTAFPQLQNNFVVLVEAESGDDARAAAEELAGLLQGNPEHYSYIYLPGADPFFRDNGFFYLDPAEIEPMAERFERVGPLLTALAEQPRLATLLAAVSAAGASEAGLDSLGSDGGRILENVAAAVESFNRDEAAAVAWDDLLSPAPSVGHQNPQVLFVQPTTDLSDIDAALESLAKVRAAAAAVAPRSGLRIQVTGDRAVHTEEMSLLLDEILVAGLLSLALVILILFLALKSFRLLIATVLTLLAGLVWTAGFAGLLVGRLNMLTTTFPVLYIGLGVDFGIHFAMGYLEGRRRSEPTDEALRLTGQRVGSSLLFCTLSTAVGFFAFIPTSYAGVAELGIISGTGIFLSLLATLTLYPAFIELGMGESEKLLTSRLARMQLALPTFPIRRPRSVCAVAFLVTLASLAALPMVQFDMNPQSVRDSRVESVQALEELLGNGEISAWTIEFLLDDREAAEAAVTRLEALPEVRRVHSPDGFLPADQAAKLALFERMRGALAASPNNGSLESGRVPGLSLQQAIASYGAMLEARSARGVASDAPLSAEIARLRIALDELARRLAVDTAALDLAALDRAVVGGLTPTLAGLQHALPARELTLSDLPESLTRRYLASDGRVRVEVFSSLDLRERGGLEDFADAVESVQSAAGGPVVATVELGRAIIESLRQAFITALVVIAGLLLLLWRSPKYTIITLIPLLIGSVMTAAFTYLADMPFNFANVVVLPLLLGIGVDSGIHLVHRHRMGLFGADTILRTGTAQAVFFSALTTIVSFSTLGFSNHLGIASFAQLLTVGIGFMLAANLLVLPAILEWLEGKP